MHQYKLEKQNKNKIKLSRGNCSVTNPAQDTKQLDALSTSHWFDLRKIAVQTTDKEEK